jgi:type IV secretion system protein VirB6
MAAQIFQSIFTYYTQGATSVINSTTSNITSNLAGPVKTALILYVIFYGIAVITGQIRELMGETIRHVMKIGVIYMLAANGSNYTTWVTNTFITALPQFTQQVTNAPAANGTVFDTFANFVADKAEQMSSDSQWYDLDVKIEAVVLEVFGYGVGALALLMELIAQVPLSLLVAVGPIFIACGLFEVTRRFFVGWLTECVTFVIVGLLLNVLLSLVMGSAQQVYQQAGNDPSAAFFVLFATLAVAILMLTMLPTMAAGIAGGRSGFIPKIPGLPGFQPRGGTGGGAVSDAAESGGGSVSKS